MARYELFEGAKLMARKKLWNYLTEHRSVGFCKEAKRWEAVQHVKSDEESLTRLPLRTVCVISISPTRTQGTCCDVRAQVLSHLRAYSSNCGNHSDDECRFHV